MFKMLKRICLKLIGRPERIKLTICRRYLDANGYYIGELYDSRGVLLGASLDNYAYDDSMLGACHVIRLDAVNDFLQPMLSGTVRVGGLCPGDHKRVQSYVAELDRWCYLVFDIQNRFIEDVQPPVDRAWVHVKGIDNA